MALTIGEWLRLTKTEKQQVVDFLRDNCKIDIERRDGHPRASSDEYTIRPGTTTSGNPIKFGEQYRIYVDDITGIPQYLSSGLRERGTRNRIGGNDAIKAIMNYGGFIEGRN